MNISKEFKNLVDKRKAYEGDIDYDSNPIIAEMIQLFTRDINKTIEFLDNECSEEQLIWFSEIFDEVSESTKSKEFIEALYRAAGRYPDAVKRYNIGFFIDSAAEYIE